MPYRAELKRPDLKGTFPCSVCGKIFCHSSSLSRHRMQAHFKSYTCTMCNQEISNKTSLHIHMQSMMRNGHPGDVHILAKSSTEGGPIVPPSPKSPITPLSATLPSPTTGANGPPIISPMPTNMESTPMGVTGIFPAMPSREELINRLRARAILTTGSGTGSGENANPQPEFLANWLANNFPPMNGRASACSPDREKADTPNTPDLSFSEGIEIRMDTDEGSEDDRDSGTSSGGQREMTTRVEPTEISEMSESLPILRSAITANPLNSLMYRKKLNNALRHKTPSQEPSLANFLSFAGGKQEPEGPKGGSGGSGRNSKSIDEIATSLASPSISQQQAMVFGGPGESQASPAGSDSQTSSSGPPMSAGSDGSSPQKCFECQVLKGKIGLADNRNKFLDSKVSSLQNKVCRLESQITSLEGNVRRYEGENKVMRDQCEVLERKLLACQEKAIRYLQNGQQGTCMKELLEDLLETTYFQYQQAKKEPIC